MAEIGALPAEIMLALEYAPTKVRANYDALLRFDARLGANVAAAKEPQLARIRLAWWRDEIGAFGSARRKPADPDLAAIYELLRRRDVAPTTLTNIIEGWDILLTSLPLTVDTLEAYATGRGRSLFAAAAEMSGSTSIERAGEAFALVDFARNCSDRVSRDHALDLASLSSPEVLSRAMRPFALMDDWARRDALRLLARRPPMSVRHRAVLALTFTITGPRS